MSGTIQKHDIISEEALKVFKDIITEFNAILSSAKDLKKNLNNSGFNDLSKDAKKAKDNVKNLTKQTKAVNSIISLGKQQIKEDLANRVGAAKKIAEIEKKKTADVKKDIAERIAAYKRVVDAEKKIAREKERRLSVAASLSKQRSREYIKELNEKAKAAQRVADAEKKQSNNASIITQKFKGLVKSVGAYMLAYMGLQQVIRLFTTTIFNMTKKLDSLHFSMKTVIKDSKEYAATTIFLTKIAINYGQDLLTLTERYIKFRAASMQSNMSAKETMKIFNSTAKAASVLGLKTDEVNGVFLALEQMISKGKVTTEELRRQLGERLPGAFGIMADAIGVSIVELDKMLKSGEVLSSEALPKFADALEKAYGIESVNKVNTLAAAQGRLKTSWVEFVDELKASNTYISVLGEMANAINDIRFSFGKISELKKYTREYGEIGDAVRTIVKEFKELDVGVSKFKDVSEYQNKWVERLKELGIGESRALRLFKEYVKLRREEISLKDKSTPYKYKPFDYNEYKKQLDKAQKDTNSYANQTSNELKKSILESSSFMGEGVTTYKQVLELQQKELSQKSKLADTWIMEFEQIKTYSKLTKEQANIYKSVSMEKIALTEAQIDVADRLASLEENASKKKQIDMGKEIDIQEMYRDRRKAYYVELLSLARGNVEETISIQRDQIKESLNNDLLTLTQRAELYAKLKQLDDDYYAWLTNKQLSVLYDNANKERVILAEQSNQSFQETNKRAKDKIAISGKLAIKLLEIEYKLANDIQSLYDKDTNEWEKQEEQKNKLKEELAKKALDVTKQYTAEEIRERERAFREIAKIGNQGFEIFSQINDNALKRANNRYEREMQAAGENESMQLSAKRKVEEEERKIAKRQAIAAKAQAAFNIGLSTSEAIMKTIGQTGFFGLPLALIVGAMGAVQLAAVLSEPLPQFEKGGIVEDKNIIVGEKGTELMILPGGEKKLTPNKKTVLTDVPIGTEIIPHDETTRLLANSAVTKTYDIIDMSTANNYLKNISKNTSESITFEHGYKIIRKKGFIGRYKL